MVVEEHVNQDVRMDVLEVAEEHVTETVDYLVIQDALELVKLHVQLHVLLHVLDLVLEVASELEWLAYKIKREMRKYGVY